MTRIHFEIPDDLHRHIKAAAAMRGVTLKEFVVDALEQALGEDHPTPPRKKPPRA